ncbi:ATP synthase subunit e, mitochondrial [Sitodiplosis mosellana]|uniref:ATP synthase subunit e, mitochondrial n=1 Tax=Sitodiplosis mosellana TaxID=263140 RepID=UPI0024442CC3|nr:ATP synthase subunit e, mitochondrial [Sitodiplosis mosellana]
MSSSAALPPPVNVAPLIRFGRWSLLTAGILYGAYHHNRLSKKEAINRKIEAEKKVIRDAQQAIEKKKRYEEEIRALEELSRPSKNVAA